MNSRQDKPIWMDTATLEISVDHCFGSLDASTGVALHRRELFLSNSGSGQPDELLEQRYKTYITSSDSDFFALYGTVNGNTYYADGQLAALAYISQYAISKGMHIIVDLLGGQNAFVNQGHTDAPYWWYNATNFDYTLQLRISAKQSLCRQTSSKPDFVNHNDCWTDDIRDSSMD
ncbi:hypothetical protein KCU78_g1191, partial [Aureobasidium melanogenum]